MFIKERIINNIKWEQYIYCFYNDLINIKKCDSNLLKIDQKSYKDTGI